MKNDISLAALLSVMAACGAPETASKDEAEARVESEDQEPIGIALDDIVYQRAGRGIDPVEWFSGAVQDKDMKTGISIGERIPAFRAMDQNGEWLDFDAVKGPKGAVLLFHRSADW